MEFVIDLCNLSADRSISITLSMYIDAHCNYETIQPGTTKTEEEPVLLHSLPVKDSKSSGI